MNTAQSTVRQQCTVLQLSSFNASSELTASLYLSVCICVLLYLPVYRILLYCIAQMGVQFNLINLLSCHCLSVTSQPVCVEQLSRFLSVCVLVCIMCMQYGNCSVKSRQQVFYMYSPLYGCSKYAYSCISIITVLLYLYAFLLF